MCVHYPLLLCCKLVFISCSESPPLAIEVKTFLCRTSHHHIQYPAQPPARLPHLSMALHIAAYGFISTSMLLANPEPSAAAAWKSTKASSSLPSCTGDVTVK